MKPLFISLVASLATIATAANSSTTFASSTSSFPGVVVIFANSTTSSTGSSSTITSTGTPTGSVSISTSSTSASSASSLSIFNSVSSGSFSLGSSLSGSSTSFVSGSFTSGSPTSASSNSGSFTSLSNTVTQSSTATTSTTLPTDSVTLQFYLQVRPVNSIGRRQSSNSGFISADGSLTQLCSSSLPYYLNGSQLWSSNGIISTSTGATTASLIPMQVPGDITTTFYFSKVLHWVNQAFLGGAAFFYIDSNGIVRADLLNAVNRNTANAVQLSFVSVTSCFSESTSSTSITAGAGNAGGQGGSSSSDGVSSLPGINSNPTYSFGDRIIVPSPTVNPYGPPYVLGSNSNGLTVIGIEIVVYISITQVIQNVGLSTITSYVTSACSSIQQPIYDVATKGMPCYICALAKQNITCPASNYLMATTTSCINPPPSYTAPAPVVVPCSSCAAVTLTAPCPIYAAMPPATKTAQVSVAKHYENVDIANSDVGVVPFLATNTPFAMTGARTIPTTVATYSAPVGSSSSLNGGSSTPVLYTASAMRIGGVAGSFMAVVAVGMAAVF